MDKKRVFLIVLDSFGIGNAPDAHLFGDEGANTLKTLYDTGELRIPNLEGMGLLHINGVEAESDVEPIGQYGCLVERSVSKDTITGHWEMMGAPQMKPFKTFPQGFSKDFLNKIEQAAGRPVLCGLPYSGTEVIRDYGEQSVKKNALIVYTSADSVIQIAAHEDIVPQEELLQICEKVRKLCDYERVGRIIARPFKGTVGNYQRCNDKRKDFPEAAPYNLIDKLHTNRYKTIAIGKIADIFGERNFSQSLHTSSNDEGMSLAKAVIHDKSADFIFINLVDFDMLYGHRRDVLGYVDAINDFDRWLGDFMVAMNDNDTIIITADHGCDPNYKGTDHTRENVPLLIFNRHIEPKNLGTLMGFDNIVSVCQEYLK